MSTHATQALDVQSPATSASVAGLAILKNWWRAFRERRVQAQTIALLQSMNDRDLKDIGLARAEIEPAVRGPSMRDRIVRYY